MLNSTEANTLNVPRRSVLYGPLFGLALALMSTSAMAQCTTGWDASGSMLVAQRGQKNSLSLGLQQKGKVLTGIATLDTNDQYMGLGTVDGTIDGDTVSFQIFWKGGLTGVYNAKILPSGRLDGETYDRIIPRSVRLGTARKSSSARHRLSIHELSSNPRSNLTAKQHQLSPLR